MPIRTSKTDSVSPGEYVPTADSRIVMHGVSWEAFERFLSLRGNARPLVAYLEGALELMSPSRDHETIRMRFAQVVMAYLDHVGVPYEGVGSWLLKHAVLEACLEPDECFILHDTSKPRPDLAIEVVWTSGGIDKLEIYRRLAIPEVWFWIDERITVHALTVDGYQRRDTSSCLPDFDFALVGEMLALPAMSDVRRALRERLPASE